MSSNGKEIQSTEIDTWKRVIAELVHDAPTDQIKECLRTYDPEIPTQQNVKSLRRMHNRDVIHDSLSYLCKGTQFTNKKDELIDKLCLKIKTFFPDVCQICDKKYMFKLIDNELLCCASCGQEVHRQCYLELLKKMNLIDEKEKIVEFLFEIPGLFFLCPACQQDTVNNGCLPKQKALSTLTSEHNSNDTALNETIKEDTHPEETSREDSAELPLSLTPSTCNIESHKESANTVENITTYENKSNSIQKKYKVCKFLRKGTCKHGISGKECSFRHPKLCNKFIQHGTRQPRGCNKGKNCQFFHPTMCLNSLRKSECFNETCKLMHIKGTVRKRKADTNLENSNTSHHHQKPIQKTTEIQQQNTPNQNFLELIKTMQSNVDRKIIALTEQIQQIQQLFPIQNLQHLHQSLATQKTANHQQMFLPPNQSFLNTRQMLQVQQMPQNNQF